MKAYLISMLFVSNNVSMPKNERKELLKDHYRKVLLELKRMCRNNNNIPVTIKDVYDVLEKHNVEPKFHKRVMELSEIMYL